jgi:hypothetical protein
MLRLFRQNLGFLGKVYLSHSPMIFIKNGLTTDNVGKAMSRTDIYAIALWLLAIPANRYLGDLAAIACGVLGIACLVVGRFHTGETGSDSILKLDVGSLPTVSAPLPWSNLESKVETTRLCLESCVVLKSEAGDLSFVAQIQNRPTESGAKIVEGARAFLEFRKLGEVIYSGNGAWVNVPHDFTTVKSGGKAALVLVMIRESTGDVIAVTNRRSKPLPRPTYSNIEYALAAMNAKTLDQRVLSEDFLTIKATLTDRDGRWLRTFNFRYEWVNGDVRITQE